MAPVFLVRAVLAEALDSLEPLAGRRESDWEARFDGFLAAFAAACLLIRGGGWVAELGANHPIQFHLVEQAGKVCLPAVELARQMLAAGAEVVALCHAGNSGRLEGEKAREALLASIRQG